MLQIPAELPEMFEKLRRPYEDTLEALGVRHVDAYLPTQDEWMKIQKLKSQQPPSAEQQEMEAKAKVNQAKVGEVMANTALIKKKIDDIDTDNMFEALAASRDKLRAVQVD